MFSAESVESKELLRGRFAFLCFLLFLLGFFFSVDAGVERMSGFFIVRMIGGFLQMLSLTGETSADWVEFGACSY